MHTVKPQAGDQSCSHGRIQWVYSAYERALVGKSDGISLRNAFSQFADAAEAQQYSLLGCKLSPALAPLIDSTIDRQAPIWPSMHS